MSTMAEPVQSPSPLGDPSRASHRSRGELRGSRSSELLDEMQQRVKDNRSKASRPMNNRQRANLMAKLNNSTGSLQSEGSYDETGNTAANRAKARRRDRESKEKDGYSRGRGARLRAKSDQSPDPDPDEGKPSSGNSRRNREGRSSRRSRSRSNSRGKSHSRSKSRKAHARKTSDRERSGPRKNRTKASSQSSASSRSASPANGSTQTPRTVARSAAKDSRLGALSPPLSASSGDSPRKKKVSEGEIMTFLKTNSTSERGGRSIPVISDDEKSAEKSDRRERRGSQRRERTVGSSGDKAPSTRPPRNNRGVGRSKSAAVTANQRSFDALVSPRARNRPTVSRRAGISSSESVGEPVRNVARSRSSDDMGELSSFFATNQGAVSRRKKPGSGSRSVASMPAGVRKTRRRMSMSDTTETTKPPSSKSTVTSGCASDGDESIDESVDVDASFKGGNRSQAMSELDGGRSLEDLESAMQMHMSKTENLLYDVFPRHIAEALRNGKKVEPENHECVTIFFSDIVGFTNISATLDPLKISDLLDRLYNAFDALSHYHDVFKVETIGDAYMAVTNLTKPQEDHCKRIAEFAIDAIRVANQTEIDKSDKSMGCVNIRVGFHSGAVVSNVVGSRNPRYCLFGDTVNTASRMESNSEVNRIHCSETSADLLREQHPNLKLNPRGAIEVKGKGEMKTFWVNEEAANLSQREGTSRSIFKKLRIRAGRRSSMV